MRRTTIIIAAMLLLASSLMAQPGHRGACGRGPAGPHGQFGDCDRPGGARGEAALLAHAEELELSETQINKIESLRFEFQMEKVDRQAELKKARLRLRSLVEDDDAAEGDVMAAIDEVSRLRADMHKLRYRHRQAVHAVLSKDQLDKLEDLSKERRRHQRMRRFGGDIDFEPGEKEITIRKVIETEP
jgi:Spy/CpxP family protein refolding chaperone